MGVETRSMRWGRRLLLVCLAAGILVGPGPRSYAQVPPCPEGGGPEPVVTEDRTQPAFFPVFGTDVSVFATEELDCRPSTIVRVTLTVWTADHLARVHEVDMDPIPGQGGYGLPYQRVRAHTVIPFDQLDVGGRYVFEYRATDGDGYVGFLARRMYSFTPLLTGDCERGPEEVLC